MANEMLQAHDTYYMDDRMVVLSVGTLCWIARHLVEFFSSVAEDSSKSLVGI
jgi:hypothetical protein